MFWLDIAALGVVGILLAVFSPTLKKVGLRGLVMVALLSALGAASQWALVGIPGVQLTTPLVILCGMLLGPGAGLMCGVVSQVLNGLVNSLGPWTIWQMLGMGLVGAFAAYLPKNSDAITKVIPPLYGFVSAFLFGWLTNVSTMLWLIGTVSWGAYLAACTASFPLDLTHSLNNLALLSVASIPAMLRKILPPKAH